MNSRKKEKKHPDRLPTHIPLSAARIIRSDVWQFWKGNFGEMDLVRINNLKCFRRKSILSAEHTHTQTYMFTCSPAYYRWLHYPHTSFAVRALVAYCRREWAAVPLLLPFKSITVSVSESPPPSNTLIMMWKSACENGVMGPNNIDLNSCTAYKLVRPKQQQQQQKKNGTGQ